MSPFVFMSGMATGATALMTAALWDSRRTEAQYSPLLQSPATLDDRQVADQLNSYFFKAQKLYADCN